MTKLTKEQQELLENWEAEWVPVWQAFRKAEKEQRSMYGIEQIKNFIKTLLGIKDAQLADAVEKERKRVIERCVDNFVYYRVTDQPIGQRRAIVSPYFLKQILKSKLSQNDQQ